jgi:small-conductance mechanosensitive channel
MEQLTTPLVDAWSNTWVRAGLIIVAAVLAAWIVRRVAVGLLQRMARRTETTLDDRFIQALRHPVFVSVLLIGLGTATAQLGLPEAFETAVMRILKTVAVFVWTVAAFRVCTVVLAGLSRLADRVTWLEARTLPLFDNLAKILVAGLAVYALLVTWQLDVGPWLASAGIVGIALGFAAKDTLANLFGGIFIMADAPFKIGDFINLGSGERGMVTKIGLRSSRLLTRDDVEITLPNAQIANSTIVNESGGPWEKARVTVVVGVAYGSDVDQVRRVLVESARSVQQVVDEPEPRVRFTEFGDSALIFRLLCWVEEPVLRGPAIDALNTTVYKRFLEEGIEIPFPQRVVHMPRPAGGD